MAGLAGGAVALALALAALDRLARASLAVVYAAELVALGIVAGVVALTGESHSAYTPFFLFPLVHVAVFQPRLRVVAAWAAGIAAYLAPVAYDSGVGADFTRVSATTVPLAVVMGAIIHLAVDALRRERRHLADREAEALE